MLFRSLPEDKVVKGLYSGGTLASEAGMLISEALDLGGLVKAEGYEIGRASCRERV